MILPLASLRLGLKSLAAHPLRSLLTALGIFIGVASVIWLLAIAEGISHQAQKQIESLGADNIIIRSVKPSSDSTIAIRGPVPYGLTRDDCQRLMQTLPTVVDLTPVRELRRQFRNGGRFMDGRLLGVRADYAHKNRLEVQQGTFLSSRAASQFDNVCVLASGVAQRLFPAEDPLGKPLAVDADYYVVVGVLEPSSLDGQVENTAGNEDTVYIPIETLWRRISDTVVTVSSGSFEGEIVEVSQATLKVRSVGEVLQTARGVRATLEDFHNRQQDYSVLVPLELLEQARTTRIMFIAFMGLIAAISLLVGGIGIMNIMLATVTERTREIGIRRALGARRRDITRQFLAETVLLSVLGGASGTLAGLACGPAARLLRYLLDRLFPAVMASLPDLMRSAEPQIVPWSIPLALGISVGVGVLFGIYPARRAAQLDPIEALRHE